MRKVLAIVAMATLAACGGSASTEVKTDSTVVTTDSTTVKADSTSTECIASDDTTTKK
jgi:hypothetical protein